MTLKRVEKVVAYITCGGKLLVFTHRDFPHVGVQVPAGTLEPGEDPAEAVLREAMEETGLENLKLVRALGTAEKDASELRPELHVRHFYHLEAAPPVPERWAHAERHPSGGDLKEIWFNCYWVDPAKIGKEEPALFFDFGAKLDKLLAGAPTKKSTPKP